MRRRVAKAKTTRLPRQWAKARHQQVHTAGHAKQAGLVAASCHAGAYTNRFVVVVEDDIDPTDMDRVIWAMCTRFDPREDMEVLRGCWSAALDELIAEGLRYLGIDDRRPV